MLYQLKDTMSGEYEFVYGVERREDKTFFLVHTKEYGWSWIDSSYVEPFVIRECGYAK